MAGHNKWSKIKHKKAKTDAQKSRMFAKRIRAISVAARKDPDPKFNPQLKNAIERAKADNVPASRIDDAISRAQESAEGLEELQFEAYGPGGVALIISAVTDNRNRTVAEIKHLLSESNGKWAEEGAVQWAFNRVDTGWEPKFPQQITEKEVKQLEKLVEKLEEHDDVESVIHNGKTQ